MATVHLLARPEPERRLRRHRGPTTAQRVADLIEAAGHDVIDISDSFAADAQRMTGSSDSTAADPQKSVVRDSLAADPQRTADISDSAAAGSPALAEGAERLVAVGGDGTVRLALQAIADTPTVLGIVPAGTGNDFARAFGLRPGADLTAAVARALGPPRAVDAIRTPRGWVATAVTGGFSGDVNRRASAMRFPSGRGRYTAATLTTLPRLRTRPVAVTADGRRRSFDAAFIVVANTAFFGGGMAICPEADPGDGLLDVLVVGAVGRVELLRLFPKVFKGTHVTHRKVSQFRGRVVEIDGDELALWGDGDPLAPAPLRLEAMPGTVRLAV